MNFFRRNRQNPVEEKLGPEEMLRQYPNGLVFMIQQRTQQYRHRFSAQDFSLKRFKEAGFKVSRTTVRNILNHLADQEKTQRAGQTRKGEPLFRRVLI